MVAYHFEITTSPPRKKDPYFHIFLFTPLGNSQQKDARATVAIFETQEEVCTNNTGPQAFSTKFNLHSVT